MIGSKYLTCLLYIFLIFNAAELRGESFLWEIRSPGGGQVYLMGSIHLGTPSFYPLNPAITDAYYRSHNLAVEFNSLRIAPESLQKMLEKGSCPPGQNALGDLSPETASLLKASPFYTEDLLHKRPWMIALTIQLAAAKQLGYDAQYGLDLYFLKLAEKEKRKIFEAETFEGQMSLWWDMTPAEADLALRAALLEAAGFPDLIAGFWDSWQKGDAEAFAKFFFQDENKYPELKPLTEKLVYERNNNMTAFIESLIRRRNETTFVVLGAGHLVGPRGVLAQLAAKGYRIKQL